MNSIVFSMARYGPETWTTRKAERSKIEAFEMKIWRKVLGISWFDHRTNDYVIERVGGPQSLLNKTTAAQLSYFGHIRRRDGTSLENTVTTGSVAGFRGQGDLEQRGKRL